MKVLFHKHFKKHYKQLRALQTKIDERLVLFMKDPFHDILNNHALGGKYEGYRSINITGDYRGLYRLLDNNTAYFTAIDTHSNLYK